jgi:hypothetical protein
MPITDLQGTFWAFNSAVICAESWGAQGQRIPSFIAERQLEYVTIAVSGSKSVSPPQRPITIAASGFSLF